jgi:sulfate/thiosulfate-binding protein
MLTRIWNVLANSRIVWQRAILTIVVGGLGLYAFSPWLPGVQGAPPRTIIVYGFSILDDVMDRGIFPAFQKEWQARTGEHFEFISSFGGSGTVTNQIIMGVPAQVAILSLELDAQKLADKGVVRGPTWRQLPHQGVLNRTPFIIIVRPGNPKHIADFADLAKPGIGVVHPDPLTSGGAQWAILAEYGSAWRTGGDAPRAYDQLLGVWRNVVAQASSARAARTQFDNGFGDALITYEQEGVYDASRGKLKGQVIYPASTILSEHTVVVVDKNVKPGERDLVNAFVNFLWSEEGQRLFVQYGFRSVDESLNGANSNLPVLSNTFTINDLGGWAKAKNDIIEGIWKKRVLTELGQ